MLHNNISDYSPITLKIAELEPGEKQKYSFVVSPGQKKLFGYQQLMVYYFCHLTNQRLILETKLMGKEYLIAKAALQVLKFFVEVPAYSDFSTREMISKSKHLSDSQAGKYFSLPYSDIETFKIVKNLGFLPYYFKIVLKNPSEELGNDLVFSASKASEKSPLSPSLMLSNIGTRSADFVEIGNQMLQEYSGILSSAYS